MIVLVLGSRIDHYLTEGHLKVVIRACLVEITKVNIDPYLFALSHMNNISEPCGIKNFNEPDCYEFINLNNNLLLKFRTESSLSLLDGLELRRYVVNLCMATLE